MFLKLEVAEERQTVVRCGGVKGSVLPVVAAPVLEEVVYGRIFLRCRDQVKSGHAL